MADTEDPSMPRLREWLEKSGLTLHELGVKMGYPETVARKAVWQLLRTGDPRIGTLRKFAEAAGIPIEELVAGPKRAGKAKK
jgi:transcriptional regulator with XRE-family HTH domain